MKSVFSIAGLYGQLCSVLRVFLTSSALILAGCSGDDASQAPSPSATQSTLNSGVMAIPISTTEADRFHTVIGTTGERYYAAGLDTTNGDRHMALARLSPTVSLDTSFGQGGIATVNVAVGGKTAEFARGVVVQSGGKIVIAGPVEHDPSATGDAARDTDIAVVRFDSTGQLDPTFGINGIVRLDLSTGVVDGLAFRGDTLWGLTLLPEDHLLVVGGKLADGAGCTDIDYAVVKLTSHGAVDTTFGTDDVVTTVLFRLLPNGRFDSSFGTNGVVNVALLASVAEAYDVALQGQNLLIAGYGRAVSPGTVDSISARFLPDGIWDKTYGEKGVAMIDVTGQDDRSRKVAILPDQRVLIVGQGKPTPTTQDGAVVLLTPDGQRDTTLNGNGVALIDFGGSADALVGLTLSPDKTGAVAVGWKGVDAAAVSPTNNDDARVVHFSLPMAQ